MESQPKPARVWLITGCSSGFGRHLSEAALARGDKVLATARDVTKLQDLERTYGALVATARLDVTDTKSIRDAVAKAMTAFGRIDVVVNNAGYGLFGCVEEVSTDQIRKVFNTNVFGVIDVMQAVLPVLRAQGSGHILNIASNGGRFALPGLSIYHGTKFAVEGISESVAQELAPLGIKLTIVEPGGFDTDFETRSLVDTAPMKEYTFVREFIQKFAANYIRSNPVAAARAMLDVVDMKDPPLRLALGINVTQHLVDKLSKDVEEYKKFDAIWTKAEPDPKTAYWSWKGVKPEGDNSSPAAE